jgi:ABC-type multidrug transport system ATPase subunit
MLVATKGFNVKHIPFSIGGVDADNFTFGHRFLSGNKKIEIKTITQYFQSLKENIVIYDKEEREKRVNYVLSAVHLDKNGDQKIGSFSGGMKQRIGIAQTLLHLPRILVVDEPTAGLDPRERIRFRNLLVDLARERIVIFSTHIIEDISSSCNQVAVINKGELKYWGFPSEMVTIANDKVWQLEVDVKDFEKYNRELSIVHHMRSGDKIKLRLIMHISHQAVNS